MKIRIASLLAVACASFAGAAAEKIVIGSTLPLTGSEAKNGAQFKDGYELAFSIANAAGGLKIGGRRVPVELRLLDDGSSADRTAQLTKELIEKDGVRVMLSTFSTRLVMAQSEVTEKHRVPMTTGGGAASGLFKRGFNYLFGLQVPVEQLPYAELRWIDSRQKEGKLPTPLRIAVLSEDTAHGKDFRAGVLDFVSKTPARRTAYQVVFDEMFAMDQKSYKPQLERVKAAYANAFLVDAHLADFIAMHREYRSMGLCHPVVTYGARGTEDKAEEALGKHTTDHILAGVWWSPLLTSNPQSRAFLASFTMRYHREPEWYEALSYEAARTMFTAIEQAGSAEPDAVQKALTTLEMPTLLPGDKLSFPADTGHQARTLFVVLQNQTDGSTAIVYPRDLATAPGELIQCGAQQAALAK